MVKYAVIGAFDVSVFYDEAPEQIAETRMENDDCSVFVTRVPESPMNALMRQDNRNRQLCYEHITDDLKKMLSEVKVSNKPLTKSETQLFHYAVMRSLGDRQVQQCGIRSESKWSVTQEERYAAAGRPTEKQKAALMRQFVLTFLRNSAPTYNCTDETLDTRLLCEFAELNFAEQSRSIMKKYREVYDKRKSRLDEQIEALKCLESEREQLASQTEEPGFAPAEAPDAAPDEEPAACEPAVIPAEPEFEYDLLNLRPMGANLPAAA